MSKKVPTKDPDLEWQIIQKIFLLIDGDKDGLISSKKIDLSQIDLRVLEHIACVLVEMDERRMILDLERFYSLCASNGIIN